MPGSYRQQVKDRKLRRDAVKEARRGSYARILIVTEGSKTEPLYLQEIRVVHQLHSAKVEVQPGQLGTAPIQVVRYAQQLLEEGDLYKGIRPRSFDQVYAVFDLLNLTFMRVNGGLGIHDALCSSVARRG